MNWSIKWISIREEKWMVMVNLYLNGILEQEGFYFIKPLLGKPGQPGFVDCLGYLKYENGSMILKRPNFSDLEVDSSNDPNCPWQVWRG